MPRALLLDSIKPIAAQTFEAAGFEVETFPKSLPAAELAESLDGVDVLGIRSGPKVSAEIIEANPTLLAIGCFCVGTDQVNKKAAIDNGIAVFNSPYENGRSVAELVMGNTYSLLRRLHEHNIALHNGQWTKSDEASYEVRDKTMGIIGYGNIGQQVSVLAEANGMNVLFYDKQDRARHGKAKKTSFQDVLANADVVTVHVSGDPDRPLIGKNELELMKTGAVLINAARANVVDYEALLELVQAGKLGGAALDVFANEPASNREPFISPLIAERKILLTPHIGGSTQEAQVEAAETVTQKLISYVTLGATAGSVNLPNLDIERVGPIAEGVTRLAYTHLNQPGANAEFSILLGEHGINIRREMLETAGEIGYAVYDVEGFVDVEELKLAASGALKHAIRTRFL